MRLTLYVGGRGEGIGNEKKSRPGIGAVRYGSRKEQSITRSTQHTLQYIQYTCISYPLHGVGPTTLFFYFHFFSFLHHDSIW